MLPYLVTLLISQLPPCCHSATLIYFVILKTPKNIMATELKINDLPIEMFVEVFKYLNIDEIAFRYTEICIHWRENIALHILAPEIIRQAKSNPSYKKLLEKNQWTEECEDVEMLIYIYNKTINPITSKFIFFGYVLQ